MRAEVSSCSIIRTKCSYEKGAGHSWRAWIQLAEVSSIEHQDHGTSKLTMFFNEIYQKEKPVRQATPLLLIRPFPRLHRNPMRPVDPGHSYAKRRNQEHYYMMVISLIFNARGVLQLVIQLDKVLVGFSKQLMEQNETLRGRCFRHIVKVAAIGVCRDEEQLR